MNENVETSKNIVEFDANGIPEISLRHLKSVLFIMQCSNMTKAAAELNRSQTAITKALITLEKSLNKQLFNRFSTGMVATVYGEALYNRVQIASNEFRKAGEAYLEYFPGKKNCQNNPIFSMEISYKRLSAFIALYNTLNIESASELLHVTKAALYSSIRHLEELLQIKLFESCPNGLTPTLYCDQLAKHVKLAFTEIRHGIEEIANIDGVTAGSVRVGSLPYTRTYLIPKAVNKLLESYPEIDIYTQEGPYSILEAELRSGEIDFIIGAVRSGTTSAGITTEILFEDKLSIIARKEHPLMNQKKISFSELVNQKWVLPSVKTPTWQLLKDVLDSDKLPMPEHAVSTSSLSIVRGLLVDSDRISLLSEHQIYYDKLTNLLDILPVEIPNSYRPIGITMRKGTHPSPAAKLFLDKIRAVAKDFKHSIK